ncbi:MAG: hypothetical protein KDK41_14675 [Leptospiraceae bacterium]|nr:hypothetical protein [Leptospiraceae bacterium]
MKYQENAKLTGIYISKGSVYLTYGKRIVRMEKTSFVSWLRGDCRE